MRVMKKLLLIILCLFIYPVFCFADLTDNGDGTITDNDTGLVWMQTTGDIDSDDDVDSDDEVNWETALIYCENLTFSGESDWRLPTIKELQSIADYSKHNPTIDTIYFPDTISTYYWSSTTYINNQDNAWAVSFYYGYVQGKPKVPDPNSAEKYYVRAVRGGL